MKNRFLLIFCLGFFGAENVALGESPSGKNSGSLGLLYYDQKREDHQPRDNGDGSTSSQTVTTKTNFTYINVTGIHYFNNFGLGARYLTHTQKTDVTTEQRFRNESDSVTENWYGLGLVAAYVADGGFFAALSYYVDNHYEVKVKSDDDDDIKMTLSGGKAYSLDLGFMFGTGAFKYGPQVLYLRYDYKSKKVDGEKSSLDGDVIDTHIIPLFSLWYFI